MNHIEVGRYWDENAEAWTALSREGYDDWRNLVNAPAFLKMLPDVTGLRGLDVGCGEGYNTRLVADRGGHLTAFDISRTFIRYAHDEALRIDAPIRHFRGSAVELPHKSEIFDFVMATMSLMDMPDVHCALAEINRVLKPGGFFQFSICHPCFHMSSSGWVFDDSGRRVGLKVSNYFSEVNGELDEEWIFSKAPRERRSQFPLFRIPRFERPLGHWLNLIVNSGFILEQFDEPHPEGETLKAFPYHPVPPTVPFSLLIRCRKPASKF